jgi:hypothetical protein
MIAFLVFLRDAFLAVLLSWVGVEAAKPDNARHNGDRSHEQNRDTHNTPEDHQPQG